MEVSSSTATHPGWSHTRRLSVRDVGEVLGAWQPSEVRVARGFPECRGLGTEQLEDIYQETAIALMSRPYGTEAHLRNALRQGIKHRALNLHRDSHRRGQILAEHAPTIHQSAEESATADSPESAAIRGEDRALILEFLAELDPFEIRVFELTAEGLRYRAIAKRLHVNVNEARRAARAVERKRIQFRFRHDLAWDPHRRARRVAPLLVPIPALAAWFSPVRRWLLGTGMSAKAGALAASVAIVGAGAIGAVDGTQRQPGQPSVIVGPPARVRPSPPPDAGVRGRAIAAPIHSRWKRGGGSVARTDRRVDPAVASEVDAAGRQAGIAVGQAEREFGPEEK